MKYVKSTGILLNRNYVNRRGLDLPKEVLWVSVCQRAAKLPSGKVGGLKKNSAMRAGAGESVSNPAAWQNFFQTLLSNTNSVQESSSTFKTFYFQSKYPYFNRAYVVSCAAVLGARICINKLRKYLLTL